MANIHSYHAALPVNVQMNYGILHAALTGGLCLSNTVMDQVRDRLGLDFLDLGEHRVKNIAHPVQVFRVPLASEARTKSPFRGLEVFEFEHADIFYGRGAAIAASKERLVQQATFCDRACRAPFPGSIQSMRTWQLSRRLASSVLITSGIFCGSRMW